MGVYPNTGDYTIALVGGAATNHCNIDFSLPNSAYTGRIEYNNSDNSMNFYTNGVATPRLTISQDGRIGINTSRATTALQVIGDGNFFGGDVSSSSVTVGTTLGSTVLGTLNAKYGVQLGGFGVTTGSGIMLASSNVAGVFSAIAFNQQGVSGNKGLILYENNSNSFKFRTNASATDRFVITSGGLVGIGVTPTSFQLH